MEYWYDMGFNETLLYVQYPFGPGLTLNTSLPPYLGSFASFRVYEILHDSGVYPVLLLGTIENSSCSLFFSPPIHRRPRSAGLVEEADAARCCAAGTRRGVVGLYARATLLSFRRCSCRSRQTWNLRCEEVPKMMAAAAPENAAALTESQNGRWIFV